MNLTRFEKLMGSWSDPQSHFDACLTNPWYRLIFGLSATVVNASERYFDSLGSSPALAPITAHSISSPMGLGSDSEPVEIMLFGKPTFLADSMQFHLEYLLRIAPRGVHYIMPTFRGEESDSRHLNEFFHVEAEFAGGIEKTFEVVEGLLGACAERILQAHGSEIAKFTGDTDHISSLVAQAKRGFKKVRFSEAVQELGGEESNFKQVNGSIVGLTSHAERELLRKYGEPLWLTYLPRLGVPFYQADEDDESARCADLLMGIGEVVGCGERHTSSESVIEALKLRQVDPTPYEWYIRLKQHYPLHTAGFGLGVERLLLWALRHDDIRDTQIFVRQRAIYGIP